MPSYNVNDVKKMDAGHGFTIVGDRNRPLVSLTFETKGEAEVARAEIAEILDRVVEITPHQ
jgi:hypothetical protein